MLSLNKEELWQKARIYNELSHHYSNIADMYVKLAQKMEDDENE